MVILGEDVGDVVVHCEATSVFGLITVQGDSREAGFGPVLRDAVVFLE